MPSECSQRIAQAAARLDAGWAVLSSPDAVGYASGHTVPIETGPSPFAGGPTLAIIGPEGEVDLVVSDLESEEAVDSAADRVSAYVGFSADQPENYLANYLAAMTTALDRSGASGRLAVQAATLPWRVAQLLESRGVTVVDGTDEFARAQMVKSRDQLVKLGRSASLAALAQRTAVASAEIGMSELELFSIVRGVVESEAGERVAFAGDLLSGVERTSAVAGWATKRRIERGDMIVTDLAPRVGGFWADSCNTFMVGKATPEFARMHELAGRALRAGISVAVPGTPVSEIDGAVRSVIAAEGFEYPHHTGHGIGTSVHEFPRIIPGESTELEVGMVILLEPGVYRAGVGGVRLEWMFEVTATGLVRLTDFEHELHPGAAS